jgi:Spy/CpxP family protein refolding chaperone
VNTWKVILATMVIFGTGVVTGGLLVKYSNASRGPRLHPSATNRPAQPISPSGMKVEFLRRAERELNLTPEQRERIDKIITASQERTKKILEPVSPKIREDMKQTKEEFRAVLTPDQQTRFDELLKQQQRPRDPRRPQPGRDKQPEGLPPGNPPAPTNSPP